MTNYMDNDEVISLLRDCDVISVPYGEKHILKQGTEVQLMQAMGGSYTVYTSEGMFRISGINADSIGRKPEPLPSIPKNISDSEFESKVWEQMKTVYDPEIPINVVDLGLIYNCEVKKDDKDVKKETERNESHTVKNCPNCQTKIRLQKGKVGTVLCPNCQRRIYTSTN